MDSRPAQELKGVIAAAVMADPGTVYAPGAVVWQEGRIVAVGPAEVAAQVQCEDLGQAVVVPGFINAHSHLELTCWHGQVPYEGSFADWIYRLHRLIRGERTDWASSTRRGLQYAAEAGTAAAADIVQFVETLPEQASAPIKTVACVELFGLAHFQVPQVRERLEQAWEQQGKEVTLAVSPHAPYSAGPEVYGEAAAFAREREALIATHLHECPEEFEFLATGRGPLENLFFHDTPERQHWSPPGCTPIQFLSRLGVLGPDLIAAHVNYISDEDLTTFADSGAQVVYCPRSHAFFQHPPHPLERLLEAGVNVALGTDSLASNDSLEMLAELKLVRRRFPALGASQIWELGTVNGARALRLENDYGTLAPGRRAVLAAISVPEEPTEANALDLALRPEARLLPRATFSPPTA